MSQLGAREQLVLELQSEDEEQDEKAGTAQGNVEREIPFLENDVALEREQDAHEEENAPRGGEVENEPPHDSAEDDPPPGRTPQGGQPGAGLFVQIKLVEVAHVATDVVLEIAA